MKNVFRKFTLAAVIGGALSLTADTKVDGSCGGSHYSMSQLIVRGNKLCPVTGIPVLPGARTTITVIDTPNKQQTTMVSCPVCAAKFGSHGSVDIGSLSPHGQTQLRKNVEVISQNPQRALVPSALAQ